MGLTANVVANTPILSAWGNEIRDRSVQRFATSTERGSQWPSPPQGAVSVLDTDPGVLWMWTGSTWRADAPRGIPIAPVTSTASMSATSSTVVDVPGLSATFTAAAGRYYKYTVTGHAVGDTAFDSLRIRVTNASNTQVGSAWDVWAFVANNGMAFALTTTELIAAAGSTTRKVRVGRQTGTGNVLIFSDATRPSGLLVEEIGAP